MRQLSEYPYYAADELGNIYSRHNGDGWRLLKPRIINSGYHVISFWKDSKRYAKTVHRVIANEFIPNPMRKECVNHKNGVKTDNRIENLEWVTKQENSQHSYKVLGNKYSTPAKGIYGKYHWCSKKISQYDMDWNLLHTFDSLQCIKRKHKFDPSQISKAARGVLKTSYGYKWKYV